MATGHSSKTPPLLKDIFDTCRGSFAAVAVFSFCINLLMLAVPLYMLQVFDRVLASQSTDTLLMLTWIVGIALVALAALEVVRSQVMLKISSWLDRRLGGIVLAGNIQTTLRQGSSPSVQGLRDLTTFRTFLTGPSIFPILDSPWTPLFILVVFLLHPVLGWIAFLGALALFGLAVGNEVATRTPLKQAGAIAVKALQDADAAVRNADVIEAMGMRSNLVNRWQRQNAETLALQSRASQRSGGITAMSKFVRLGLQVAMIGAGAWLVMQNELTPGGMIAASILMARSLAPVEQAIASWRSAIAAHTAYERVKGQLAAAEAWRDESTPLPAPSGALSVEGVTYLHPNATEPVLHSIAFKLKPGEALGLIGPSAAGKTTLARLLVGNLQPRVGFVRLDGMNVAQWDAEDLGRHVGYLPQDVELFSGTVRENIARMSAGDVNSVIAAAKLAGVHDMILRLPAGYDTEIGEAGAALSGGERQRIGLARALYEDPQFIVLDEPNASLDHVGEEALVRAIGLLKKRGATQVVIAHRPNILRHVDKVLVLRNGGIQAFGPRDEVLQKLIGPTPATPPAHRSKGSHG